MKKIIVLLMMLPLFVSAQNSDDDKTFGQVQVGLLGVWGSYETNIAKELALRSELGVNLGFLSGSIYSKNVLFVVPSLTIEPRWYYNLSEREAMGVNTRYNNANFVSLNASYYSGKFVIANDENLKKANVVDLGLNWGFRYCWSSLGLEGSIGPTYYYAYSDDIDSYKNERGFLLQATLRIGLNFSR